MNSLLLHVFLQLRGQLGGGGVSGLEKKLRAPQRNLCSPGMLSRSLTQQSKAGWLGDWVQPHHLDGNVISKEFFSVYMVGIRWGKWLFEAPHTEFCVGVLNNHVYSVSNGLYFCLNREAKGVQAFQDFQALLATQARRETG